jgi:hypothetical protein
MKKQNVLISATMILLFGVGSAFGQTVSEEAKRHFDRGMAAADMAKSPNDYAAAIYEFEQAARLALDWPDVYCSLGKVQEIAGKCGDAAKSLRQYLRLAPDASDAEEIKSLINKLEYKAERENILTIADIVDVLVSYGNEETWETVKRGKYDQYNNIDWTCDCGFFDLFASITRAGNDRIKVPKTIS